MLRPVASLLGTALILAVPAVAHADKLVIFHNGRTLRVQEIRQDGEWSFLTLGKRSEMGVLARLIANIEEVDGSLPDTVPNVRAPAAADEGGVMTMRGGRPAPTRIVGRDNPDPDQPIPMTLEGAGEVDPEAAAAAARARSDALARAAARGGRGRMAEGQDGHAEAPPGVELGSGSTPGRWPSLLERGRPRGRDAGAGEEAGEDDADPQR